MNSRLVSMQWQIVKRQSDEMYILREALVRISVYVLIKYGVFTAI